MAVRAESVLRYEHDLPRWGFLGHVLEQPSCTTCRDSLENGASSKFDVSEAESGGQVVRPREHARQVLPKIGAGGEVHTAPDGLIGERLPLDEPGVMVNLVDSSKRYYDASRPYRLDSINGKWNSGEIVDDVRSKDHQSYE